MRVTRLSLRSFRSYEAAEVRLGPGLTVITGPNGAGKTNLLEAVYFACTGRSCRTANEREVVRFGAGVARLELGAEASDGEAHRITVGFAPGEAKRLQVDGAAVDRLTNVGARPLVSVFLPDRLELVVGAPALRRAHLDQVIAALWPARVGTRRAYTAALAQRNALIAAIRAGRAGRPAPPARPGARGGRGPSSPPATGSRSPPIAPPRSRSWPRRSPRPPRRSASRPAWRQRIGRIRGPPRLWSSSLDV